VRREERIEESSGRGPKECGRGARGAGTCGAREEKGGREIRKANIPARDPTVSRYAMIENKVRDRGRLSHNAFLNSSLRVAKYALRFS
jgi:hypothetical protein